MPVMYKPLPNNCTIGKSPIHGLGLFATLAIPEMYNFGITHIMDEEFEDGYIRTPLGGFFNHSDSPNCKVIKEGRFLLLVSIKEIQPGDEITAFYTLYIPKHGEK